ncbi:MAG TPA: PDZ domain-containing protein [Myxococcales bacterium]|nr:PDZ domain-containing protein [Myxococcales bacterium]
MNDYVLRIAEAEARRLEVELHVQPRGEKSLEFRLPVWTPGSYLIREHQRHVDGVTATSGGRQLAVTKSDKHTWRVETNGGEPVKLSYRLHCFELTVRTNHIDQTHGFINPSAALMFAVGRENEPCSVRLQLPAGWKTWVALPQKEGAYRASDYDELADSPFELGPDASHETHKFEAQGVPHELVVWGKGDFDAGRAVPDMVKIIDALSALFGGLPYREKYLFILHLNDKGRGGLEHRQSCALIVTRFSFVQKAAYEDYLQLVAHEFFHLWNVKRLRPMAFTPYDWTRENHTGLLWAMEGLTSFYEVMALRRAGLITPGRFLEIWAERVTQLLRTPGRLRVSLRQASYDAWIKHYRPDESTSNTSVSYYLKGSVVGFLLDLELRRRTHGQKSLDDVMRALFASHGKPPGLPEDGVESAASAVAGESMAAWFDRAIRSTQELQLDEALAGAGLLASLHAAQSADDKGSVEDEPQTPSDAAPRAWLGASLRDRAGSLEVASVVEGSPAQKAGLGGGDEVIAIDGIRGDLKARLGRAQPGLAVKLSVFRMDELLEVVVPLGQAPRDTVTFAPSPATGEAEHALREQWLGAQWP